METKKASKILAVALSFAAIAVYGCGGGGGGGGGTTGGTTTGGTTITGATQANSAGASATQTASIGSNTGQSLSNIASIGGSGTGCPTCAPQYKSPLAGKDKRFNKMHAAQVKAFKSPIARKAAFLKKAKAAATYNAPTTIPSTPVACNDGGTVTIGGSYDDVASTFTLTMTYNDCLEYGERLNGPMSISGSFSATGNETFTITIGDGDGTIELTDFKAEQFMDTTYTTLYAYYLADMSVSASGEVLSTGNYSFTMTANGKEKYSDYTEVYNMTFSNLKFVSTFVAPATPTSAFSGTDTVDGGFTESWTGTSGTESVSTTFTSFVIAWSVPAGAAYYEFSADGTVATDFTPNAYCGIEGTWVIDTTTPIQIDNNGVPLQGVMVINSNVTIKFDDPDGSGKVTVTVTGGTPTTYNSINELEATCKMADFEEDTTASTTVTSTTQNQTVPGTPSSMVITVKSTFPIGSASLLDCYTDLHVNFYRAASYPGTAPTSTTPGTWYVDWNIQLIGVGADGKQGTSDDAASCTSPADGSVIYWEALDLNGDGVCDVGLDVDGLELDNAHNGIEHFVAKTLPAGYYVVSVNNYSCANDVKSAVSIQIGNSLYEGYTGTYTSGLSFGDVEGTDSGSWYRVTDIRVNADGTVNLLTPDTTLLPWHDSVAFGMSPLKKARGLK